MKTDRLLQDLGGGHADRTWENRLTKYILADLLVLDDFGMKELSPQEAEDLYELICERYRGGSMIVVSNRAPKDWYALFPNPVFAEGALDRLAGTHQRWVALTRSSCRGRSTVLSTDLVKKRSCSLRKRRQARACVLGTTKRRVS